MLLSAIVVNFNGGSQALSSVQSVLDAISHIPAPTELAVADNGSVDGSRESIRNLASPLRLIEMGANVGFARAVAEGIRQTTGRWLLLLNNDATIDPSAVERLIEVGERDDRIGIVAPTILFDDGSETINSAGLIVDRLGVAHDRFVGEPAWTRGREPTEVFGASAGGVLLRRAMLEDVGGLDESFFMYLEDVDLAWRARARGWRAVHVPEATVMHRHSMTAVHGSELKYFFVGLNRVRVLAKNASRRQLLRYGPAMVAYDIAYVAYAAVTDRTLAPLRGRITGVSEWRRYRRHQSGGLEVNEFAPISGIRAALERRRTWLEHSGRRGARP